jgi:hypothetical protein
MGTACTHFRGGERSGEESDEEPADDSVTDSSRWKVARVCNTGLSVCRHSPFLLEPAGEEACPNKKRDCSSFAGMDIIPGNDVTHSFTASGAVVSGTLLGSTGLQRTGMIIFIIIIIINTDVS